ncbi:MAG TPA: efflux RND transporter periplasmic adaptor subunit [Caulobacteraceae bacterium]|nr:efflux RND transporter periplasmic adaptor subunit [Caulobacteraceae bacterium]
MSQTESAAPAPRAVTPRGSRRRALMGVVVVVAVTVIVGLILTRCASRGAQVGPRRPTITVGVAKAVRGDVPITLDALGTATSPATVNVVARVSGMLVAVNFREGQLVRKGELLATIDPRPFRVALQQAQAQQLHDEASLANARLDLARYQTLVAENSIARQQADTQAATVRQDEATVAADAAQVANARLNLSFTAIPAPVSGRVGLRQIDPGNQITANSATPMAVVTQIDPMDVVFSLPEEDIGLLGPRASISGGLPVTALDRSGGEVLAQGVLSTVDNVIDTSTGTVKAKARFPNGAGKLFPNEFVNVRMLVTTLHDQVIVPTTAVRHGPQGDFVWLLQPGQTVRARTVTTGPGTGETVSITQGLAAGDTVITEGGDRLRDGARVVLPGQRPAAGFGGGGRGGRHGGHGGGRRGGYRGGGGGGFSGGPG